MQLLALLVVGGVILGGACTIACIYGMATVILLGQMVCYKGVLLQYTVHVVISCCHSTIYSDVYGG